MNTHQILVPLALFAVLREDDFGLYFETEPLDDVPNADRTIKQINSGTLFQSNTLRQRGLYLIGDRAPLAFYGFVNVVLQFMTG